MPSNGTAIAAGMIGAGLLWSALFNKSLLSTAKSVVQGKAPTPGPEVAPPITAGAAVSGLLSSGSGIPGVTVGIPAGVAAGGNNRALGQSMAAELGWTGAQWTALDQLWERESGWSNTADNPTSGAYGIPQSLPYSKMPKAAWPPSAGGSANAGAQIQWGLAYIKGRYGTPEAAWQHELANDWY